jgi:hypothetical protein
VVSLTTRTLATARTGDGVDHLDVGRSGAEDGADSCFVEVWDVGGWNDASDDDGTAGAGAPEGADDPRRDREVRAVVHRDADCIDVFLDGGDGDRLGCLTETEVDDFEASVSKCASHDLDAAIVTVETNLRDEDSSLHATSRSTQLPNTDSSVEVISPTVAYAFTAARIVGTRFTHGSAASMRI